MVQDHSSTSWINIQVHHPCLGQTPQIIVVNIVVHSIISSTSIESRKLNFKNVSTGIAILRPSLYNIITAAVP
jgi:hypothetical protein